MVHIKLHVLLPYCFGTYVLGHNRHVFLRGQSHFSWLFFPVENFHFGRPKTNFRRFQKWKAKKKKKVLISSFYITFPTSILPIFHLPFYNFPSFLLDFHPFPPCLLFSRYVSKNFPVRGLWGALCPRLLRHCLCSLVQVLCQELQSPPSECEFHHFSKLTLLLCLLHNLFSFKFSANLTSKNVRGNHIVSSLVCSLASEFTNQKFSKTSTFSCPYLIFHSVILLTPPFQYIFFQTFLMPISDFSFHDSFNPPPLSNISSSKHWCIVCSKNICGNMYQLCLHSSVVMLFKTYGFSGCPCACIWAPRKFSSKELDPVSYIVGSQWRNVQEASVEIHFTCH